MGTAQNYTADSSFWETKGFNEFVDKWFLMSSPVPVLIIFAFYISFVLKLGPDLMKTRQPFTLNNVILLYNFMQVAISVFIFQYGLNLLSRTGLIHSVCELNEDHIIPLAYGMYYYLSAKISELLDTIFFVLRKKDNQISFLHVYHHALMMLTTWYFLKYEPTYTVVFLGTINSFVHIVMYSYYALSTFPGLAPYLWWKKYITSMQLIQFGFIIVQVCLNYYHSGCPPSTFLLFTIILNAFLMIYLFSDFYFKAYSTKNNSNISKNNSRAAKSNVKFTYAIDNLCGVSHEKIH